MASDAAAGSAMLLSVCIPTHQGRLGVLRGAIESVRTQLTPELRDRVEICVSDNASQDGTREAMREYADVVRYHRNEQNQGFPRNLHRLVEMSRGRFCWFLGSDDELEPGSLKQVLELLERHPDVAGLTVNRRNYDRKLERLVWQDPPALLPADPERPHVYTSPTEIFSNVGMAHTYITAQIFDRQMWLDIVGETNIDDIDRRFMYYPHLYVWGRMALLRPHWVWHPERLVKYRTDNDASVENLGNEWHTHVLVTMRGLAWVWAALFGKRSPMYRAVMSRYLRFSWTPGVVAFCKSRRNYSLRDEVPFLVGFAKYLYFLPEFWRGTFLSLLVPHVAYKAASRYAVRSKLRAVRDRVVRAFA